MLTSLICGWIVLDLFTCLNAQAALGLVLKSCFVVLPIFFFSSQGMAGLLQMKEACGRLGALNVKQLSITSEKEDFGV